MRVGSGTDWVAVVSGNSHCVGIRADSSVWTWGDPDFGQLGLGDLDNRLRPAFAFYLDDVTAPATTVSGADDLYHATPVSLEFGAGDGSRVGRRLDAGVGRRRRQLGAELVGDDRRARRPFGRRPSQRHLPLRGQGRQRRGVARGDRQHRHHGAGMTHDYDGEWHAGSVTVTFAATDALSGVSQAWVMLPNGQTLYDQASVTLRTWKRGGNSGEHLLTFAATDAAGNAPSAPETVVVKLDGRAPATTDDAPVEPQTADVTVHLTANDAHSGVALTRYSLDGGDWQAGSEVAVRARPNGGDDGVHWIAYTSVDLVGNQECTKWCCVTIAAGGSWSKAAAKRR